jgi:hypothetical protein
VTYVTLWGVPWHRQMGMEDVNIKELEEVRGTLRTKCSVRFFDDKRMLPGPLRLG